MQREPLKGEMMKKFGICLTLVALALVVAPAVAAPEAAFIAPRGTFPPVASEQGAILYDQTGACGASGAAVEEFTAPNEAFSSEGADDFNVPAGFIWQIDSVRAVGQYFNGFGPNQGVANVNFYDDAACTPDTAVCSYAALAVANPASNEVVVTLPASCDLKGPGTYWVSVQPVMNFGVGGQWAWTEATVVNCDGQWWNPPGGFGTPCNANWGSPIACGIGVATNDYCWSISGTEVPQGGLGSCCDEITGACDTDVEFADCDGTWTVDGDCSDCFEATGACCDLVDETCTNDVVNGDCAGGNQSWSINETCETLCGLPDGTIHIEILTDNFGAETSWEVVDQADSSVVASGNTPANNTLFEFDVDVSGCGCYSFTIFDSFGDGICCGFGEGAYSVSYNGNEVCSGGEFDDSETCSDIGGCFGPDEPRCPAPATGACCNFNGDCADDLTNAECGDYGVNGGDWYKGMACDDITCEAIPTVSEWGLVVMTLLGCTLGTILYGRRRAARTA